MRKQIALFTLVLLFFLFITGCGNEVKPSNDIEMDEDFKGKIVEINLQENRFLLSVEKYKFYETDKIWIYAGEDVVDFEKLDEGQVVRVWSDDAIKESLPPQTGAKKIEIID